MHGVRSRSRLADHPRVLRRPRIRVGAFDRARPNVPRDGSRGRIPIAWSPVSGCVRRLEIWAAVTDEKIYWEQRFKKHGGIQIIYVHGDFKNDGSLSDTLLKVVKHAEAHEYSMKLSEVTLRGAKSHAALGHSAGGAARSAMTVWRSIPPAIRCV